MNKFINGYERTLKISGKAIKHNSRTGFILVELSLFINFRRDLNAFLIKLIRRIKKVVKSKKFIRKIEGTKNK